MNLFFKLFKFVQRVFELLYSYNVRHTFSNCPSSVRFEVLGYLHGARFITIGQNCSIQRGCYLTAWDSYVQQHFSPKIVIGTGVNIGAYNHITAINKIVIGDGCLTGKWVTISDNSHGGINPLDESIVSPSSRPLYSKGGIIIEKNVWICDKATILSGVTIGEGAIIAANSVVTHDVPSYSIVAGCPAKIVRKLK